ncbi:MAG: hypothetical protein D6801_08395 [Alphaproteobacteria bacterium]|nr:MAG: hypothetical protein D6801_08395 [Alphaproteobacteria bacterium]
MTEQDTKPVPSWKIIVAFLLDLLTSFLVIGYIIAWATGGLTESGFSLEGGPALLLFALVIVYFVGLGRYGGGTIWQRVLGTNR